VGDYFDNFFNLKYALENLLGKEVDLVEGQTVRNPYLKEEIDQHKVLIYG
jgi:predicted nucleotidyltransferase